VPEQPPENPTQQTENPQNQNTPPSPTTPIVTVNDSSITSTATSTAVTNNGTSYNEQQTAITDNPKIEEQNPLTSVAGVSNKPYSNTATVQRTPIEELIAAIGIFLVLLGVFLYARRWFISHP